MLRYIMDTNRDGGSGMLRDIRIQHLRYDIFYELLRFLMISKGSWVAVSHFCQVTQVVQSSNSSSSVKQLK